MSRTLNGVLGCGYNKPSVSRIHVFDFDDLRGFTYENDNLDFITGYSAINLPVMYRPHKSGTTYNATQNEGNSALFTHQLTLNFPKLSEAKRNEFIGLKSRDLSVIIEDANGNAWLMGQDFPVRFESLNLQTGANEGSNDYTLVLVSVEKEQLKRIEPPDENCFASFYAEEERISTFVIDNATSNFTWNSLTFSANDQSINVNQTFAPQLWNAVPAIKAADELKFLNAFGIGGNVTAITCSYISLIDSVYITIYSPDTRFANLFIGGDFAAKGLFQLNINFKAVLTPNLQNSNTQLKLVDSIDGEIFTADYGESVAPYHPRVGGISNDCTYKVSDIFENRTFTFSIPNNPLCGTVQYEYFHENVLYPCSASATLVDYYKGNKQYITIPHNIYSHPDNTGEQPPKYQRIEFNIYGVVYRLYMSVSEFNDDIVQLKTDIQTAITLAGSTFINVNSVECVEVGNNTRVYFDTFGISPNITDPHFRGWAARTIGKTLNSVNGWKQSRLLQLNTLAPINAEIEHETEDNEKVNGTYLVDIDSTDIELEETPNTQSQTIDKIGLVWAFDDNFNHEENEIITTSVDADCVVPTIETETSKCYDNFTSAYVKTFLRAFLDASTEPNFPSTLEINVNGAIQTIIIPALVTPLTNHQQASNAFRVVKGVSLFDFVFDSHAQQWVLQLLTDPTAAIIYIKDLTYGRNFTFSSINQVYDIKLTKNINPYQKLKWSGMPTIEPFGGVAMDSLNDGQFHIKSKLVELVKLEFNGANYELTITRQNTVSPFDQMPLRFEFFTNTDYPVAGVPYEDTITMSGGVNSVVIDLSTSFADKTTGLMTVLTNSFGETIYNWLDIDTAGLTSDSIYYEVSEAPILWGTRDRLFYVGTDVQTQEPVVQSTICNGIIVNDAVLVAWSMLVLTSGGNKVRFTASVSGQDRLLIDRFEIEALPLESASEPNDPPALLNLISDNGTEAYFESDPQEFTDPNDIIGFLYELTFTALDVGELPILGATEEIIAESF